MYASHGWERACNLTGLLRLRKHLKGGCEVRLLFANALAGVDPPGA